MASSSSCHGEAAKLPDEPTPRYSDEEVETVAMVLANFDRYMLGSNMWLALNPTEGFTLHHPEQTLAVRLAPLLRYGPESLDTLLQEAGIKSKSILQLTKTLQHKRLDGTPLLIAKRDSLRYGRVHCLLFGAADPASSPDNQLDEPGSPASPIANTHRALEALLRSKTLRSAGPAASAAPPDTLRTPVPLLLTAPPPRTQPRQTLRHILDALAVPRPHCDASGACLPASLLDYSFTVGLEHMSAGSSKRRQLLQAAAAVTHWALAALAPEPMVTAAALTEPPKRAGTDPMRTALSTSKPPTGRRLMQLLSESHLAQSLVRAYICAEQRGEKVSVKAQILAPLTTQYSLRVFNECFVDGPSSVQVQCKRRARRHSPPPADTPRQRPRRRG